MHLLFVANFAAGEGYAWETIERVFRRAGERLVRDGHRVTVCYAAMEGGPPPRMRGAPFEFAAFDYARVGRPGGVLAFVRLLRERRVDALYLTDRATRSWRYAVYRAAGVRRIVVHDRTSGARTRRGAPARLAKRMLHALPLLSADCCIAVSEYVRRRLVEVNGVPPDRAVLVHNGIDLARFDVPDRDALHRALGVEEGTPVVFCSARAQEYKGVQVLVDAAALLREGGMGEVAFAFVGDGPYLEALRERAARLRLNRFHFLGKRDDVARLLSGAAVAAVPSLWDEAFGLTVVEAMAAEVPVVATRAGGIPELVREGETGVLVEPGNAAALADAIRSLLEHPAAAREMAGRAAREARRRFGLERCAADLYAVVSSLLRTPPVPALRLAR